jgi:hypothetical protein
MLAWVTITNTACEEVLGCSTECLYLTKMALKEGGIYNN